MVAFHIAPPIVGDTAMSPICMAPASPCIRPWYAGSAVFMICSGNCVIDVKKPDEEGRVCKRSSDSTVVV